ncbi:MAG: hypothetical protein Q7U57_14005 [Methylovulum sp.]|nr:hypothetical protein [Methylovulum sp.]
MKYIILIGLAATLVPAQADVVKCQIPGQKTIYQNAPCPAGAVNQQAIAIQKPDPAKVAEAEAKLKTWQAELAAKEAATRKAEQERQEAADRQAAIDALNRSAKAQEELAEAAKRPVIVNQPLLINPYIGLPPAPHNHKYHRRGRH